MRGAGGRQQALATRARVDGAPPNQIFPDSQPRLPFSTRPNTLATGVVTDVLTARYTRRYNARTSSRAHTPTPSPHRSSTSAPATPRRFHRSPRIPPPVPRTRLWTRRTSRSYSTAGAARPSRPPPRRRRRGKRPRTSHAPSPRWMQSSTHRRVCPRRQSQRLGRRRRRATNEPPRAPSRRRRAPRRRRRGYSPSAPWNARAGGSRGAAI